MGGLIEHGADGSGYSECWLEANPVSSSLPSA